MPDSPRERRQRAAQKALTAIRDSDEDPQVILSERLVVDVLVTWDGVSVDGGDDEQ